MKYQTTPQTTFLTTFTKMCGAGNDFLITDEERLFQFLNHKPSTPHSQIKENEALEIFSNKSFNSEKLFSYLKSKIKKLCDRRFGIGADGLCYLKINKDYSIEWNFFNSDGSTATMCGNAACCIIDYLFKRNLISSSQKLLNITILNKTLKGGLDPHGQAQILSALPQILNNETSICFEGRTIPYKIIDSGVQHVLINDSILDKPSKNQFEFFTEKALNSLKVLSKELRIKHPDANITFYTCSNQNEIKAISFERGVENFTLSCGTGALAVGYHLLNSRLKDMKYPTFLKVEMKGGTLEVSFDQNQSFLRSPVHLIAEISSYLF